MNTATILALTRTNLQLTGTAYDGYLTSTINMAIEAVGREGITLADNTEDQMLVSMYAAYLFRHRRSNEPMPRMLRYLLNNRLISEKGAES